MTNAVVQTEVQEIKAAVAALTRLKEMSQGETWYRSIRGVSVYGGEFGASPEGIVDTQSGCRSMHTPQCTPIDADLIVTLHRTVAAQLAFLGEHFHEITHTTEPVNEYALALARAINGPAA